MGQSDLPQKVHPLSFSSHLLLFVPGIMSAFFPIIFAFDNTPFREDWPAYLLCLGMTGITFYCGITTRLVTSSEGIKNYFLYPLYFMVPWNTLTFMGRNQHGIVNLFYTVREKPNWLQRLGRLELSYFVDDWETSELVAEIKKYAPHVKIPEDLLAQPQLKIWQRPGMILLYYVVSLFLTIAIILIAYLPYLQPIRFTLLLAGYGFWGGIFGGMMSLFDYSSWLKYQTNKKFFSKVGRMARLNYLLPFRGWALAFLFGLIAQGLILGWNYSGPDYEGSLFNVLSFLIGLTQAFWVPYRKSTDEA